MADDKKTPTGAEKAPNEAAKKKAPAAKESAKKAEAKAKPAAKDSAEKKAAPKKAAAKKPAAKKEPTAKPEPKKKAAEGKTPAGKATVDPKEAPATQRRRRKREPAPELPVVRASARYVRIAPRKARLVADQVRGMHIDRARALLQFSPRSAARDIHKLIDSAASNAENNHELIGDEMKIAQITVDEGPTLRRFRPRAQGRATRINKRTCHISVALTPDSEDF